MKQIRFSEHRKQWDVDQLRIAVYLTTEDVTVHVPNIYCCWYWFRVAQSVYRLVARWTVRESNPGGDETFRTHPDQP